jgi:hypothetical protein
MRRRIVWSLVAVISLATLATAWFVRNFEEVPYERWEPPQKEALRNPHLAFERLLAQMGRPVIRIESPQLLDELPAGGVVFLDRNRRRHVDPVRAERLLGWVERGGYLIVASEVVGDDPLLETLGLSRYEPPASEDDDEDEEFDENEDAVDDAVAPAAKAQLPAWIDVRLPDADVVYRYRRPGADLVVSQAAPAWRAGIDDERSALIHIAHGAGQVTVLDGLDVFNNYQIGNFDHAEFLWALIQRYQPQGEIRLASRLAVPTLWQWLAESASAALLSVCVLMAVWLWRIVPRFGGAVVVPASERRELSHHLAAIGRSVWREGGLGHWLNVVRQAVATRLALHHPHLTRLDAAGQQAALAKLADSSSRQAWSALTTGKADTPEAFTTAMQTLQRLDQRI